MNNLEYKLKWIAWHSIKVIQYAVCLVLLVAAAFIIWTALSAGPDSKIVMVSNPISEDIEVVVAGVDTQKTFLSGGSVVEVELSRDSFLAREYEEIFVDTENGYIVFYGFEGGPGNLVFKLRLDADERDWAKQASILSFKDNVFEVQYEASTTAYIVVMLWLLATAAGVLLFTYWIVKARVPRFYY